MFIFITKLGYEKCLKSWKQNWSQTTLLRSYHTVQDDLGCNYRHQLFLSMNNNGYRMVDLKCFTFEAFFLGSLSLTMIHHMQVIFLI